MRINFSQLFVVQNGMISPKVQIHLNGVTMSPGVSFGIGVSFGGIDLSQYIGKDFDVNIENDIYYIKGIFN
jgi:hypothetical protein